MVHNTIDKIQVCSKRMQNMCNECFCGLMLHVLIVLLNNLHSRFIIPNLQCYFPVDPFIKHLNQTSFINILIVTHGLLMKQLQLNDPASVNELVKFRSY